MAEQPRHRPRARSTAVSAAVALPLALALALLAAGCGSAVLPTPLHAAPEPASAPPPTAAPAGVVLTLTAGSHPEGAAFDPASGLVAIGVRDPDRVALVNPVTRSVRYVAVPGSARHLELAAPGLLLVPGEDTALVATVALPAGNVTHTVKVLRQPHDVAVVDADDWYVADEFGPAVSYIHDGAVAATFRGKLQPGGAAAAGDTAAVVDVRQRLLWLYRDGRQIGHLDAGVGPTHAVAIGGSMLVVTDTTGGALLVYDLSGHGRQVGSLAAPGEPYGTAYDPVRHQLWITETGANRLVGYSVAGSRLTPIASYPTVRDAYSVAVDSADGTLVVAGESGGQLQIITR